MITSPQSLSRGEFFETFCTWMCLNISIPIFLAHFATYRINIPNLPSKKAKMVLFRKLLPKIYEIWTLLSEMKTYSHRYICTKIPETDPKRHAGLRIPPLWWVPPAYPNNRQNEVLFYHYIKNRSTVRLRIYMRSSSFLLALSIK